MKRLLAVLTLLLCIVVPGQAQEVTGLSGWNIYLDPGHFGNGNRGFAGYSEAHKVLRVGLALRERLLETTDIDTVYISRTNDSQEVSLSQRVDHANTVAAAYFHSIHSNAAGPTANFVFTLWPQLLSGEEASPEGGRRMAGTMTDHLSRAMRIPSRGGIGECDFYGYGNCRSLEHSYKGSRNYVQSFTMMASSLSEAGFHTNPTQNQRNMNADWKRLEARAMLRAITDFHGLPRPPADVLTGIVYDAESGLPVNGAAVEVGDATYVTDTFESLFHRYSDDPGELRNGFYYLDDLAPATYRVTVQAAGFEPYAADVAVTDTSFTFHDVALVSDALPVVLASEPVTGEGFHRIVDPVVLTFNRPMDAASVEAAFSIDPAVAGTFTWGDDGRRLVFRPDSLMPRTQYVVSVGAGARGALDHTFDGDGDGTAGGTFVLAFTTGFRDTSPPRIAGSFPRPNATDVALRPVLSLTYDEPLDAASVAGRFALELLADGSTAPARVAYYRVGERGVVNVFPTDALQPDAYYRLVVAPGLRDLQHNAETDPKYVRFRTGTTQQQVTVVDDFEAGLVGWWQPQQSGSSAGFVTASTATAAQDSVVNHLTGSLQAMRIDYGWDVDAGTKLLRVYAEPGEAPAAAVSFDSTYTLEAFVFGDGSGNGFRFAVDDAGGTEVSPWFTVDWIGWRRVAWDMGRDGTGAWIGDGTLDGRLRLDSFQLTHADGGDAFGRFYVDDLRLVRPASGVAAEPALEVPDRVRLHPNYPNPFNPTTTLRFELDAPSAATLVVYDALGAEVARLVDGRTFAAGAHTVTWDAGGLPSGLYFARLRAAGALRTVKMVLLK